MQGRFKLNMDEYLPLRDVVFQALRKAILTGDLKPGERLMEIHLADELGVSRTPIREAIRKLELEGLVTMLPRRGAQVAEISEKGLRDVLEVRRALDIFCAETACERIDDIGKEELKAACENFEAAVKTGDASKIAKADVEFHDIIIRATGNERIVVVINNLAEQMYRYRFEYIKDESIHSQLIEEHRALTKAITEGNLKDAEDAAGRHIDNQEASILKQLRIDTASQKS